MNVVDSSGWLEFFANAPNAQFFAEPLATPEILIVPVVSVFEVFKRLLLECGEGPALQAVAAMQQPQVAAVAVVEAAHRTRPTRRVRRRRTRSVGGFRCTTRSTAYAANCVSP